MPVRAFIVLDYLDMNVITIGVVFVLMPVRAFIVLDPVKHSPVRQWLLRLNAREGIYCFGLLKNFL